MVHRRQGTEHLGGLVVWFACTATVQERRHVDAVRTGMSLEGRSTGKEIKSRPTVQLLLLLR